MKKFFAVILALAMTLAMGATVMAGDGNQRIVASPLHDNANPSMSQDEIAPNYKVTVEDDVITISADYVKPHTNGDSRVGRWVGCSAIAPEGATNYKAVAGGTNPSSEALSVLDQNVDGEGSAGIAFYFDADYFLGKEGSSDTISFQWFNGPENSIGDVQTYTVKYEQKEGQITINRREGSTNKEKYCVYQMFEVVSYSDDGVQYKVVEEWEPFFEENASGHAYINLDNMGQPEWQQGMERDSAKADFAKVALAWAQEKQITPNKCITVEDNEGSVVFTGLPLGYYLVDSSLGTICMLDSTNPSVEIDEKNPLPEPEKTIPEGPGSDGDANVGDVIHYEATIKDAAGTNTLSYHDKMTGLKFNDDIKIVLKKENTEEQLELKKDYTIDDDSGDYTFVIKFRQTFVDTIELGDVIHITYSATVTDKAIIQSAENGYGINYGDDGQHTSENKPPVKVYTWGFEVFKHAGGVQQSPKGLTGAQFVLSKTVGHEKQYATWNKPENDELYHFTGWVAENASIPPYTETMIMESDDKGMIKVAGIDSGEYNLTEIKAPDGYNLLLDPVKVKIEAVQENGKLTGDCNITIGNELIEGHGIQFDVENNAGSELPSTGGIGTTIFYIVGGLLVAFAVVLLITKRRMSGDER